MTTLAILALLLEEAPEGSSDGSYFVPIAVALGVVLLLKFRPGRK